MTYSNNANDTTSYPTYPTFGEFNAYPTLGQMSATEEDARAPNTSAHGWGMGGQPSYMVNSQRSLRPEASFGEYDYGLLDDVRLTQVSRLGDFCHLTHTPRPRPRAANVSCPLLADNRPLRPVVPFRHREPG